eukprot:TRINITY_DN23226_c0_g1_i1.p1 TRINITY_DN23226_c0_g1~~TRINITY_DN23226_c0_g1_i1.p1  ORF type:complete len:749 (+),score=135.68 TRINITY_DN23226_c0_g1_i1:95-2248(+)
MARATLKRRWEIVLFLLLMCVAYLLIGGAVMYVLEHDLEVEHLEDARMEIEYLSTGQARLDAYHMNKLEQDGVCNFPKNDSQPHWTFTGATFYSMTVITTIGFGSFAPSTWNGRSFSAVYAVLGISIFGQLLTEIAVALAGAGKVALGRIGIGDGSEGGTTRHPEWEDPSDDAGKWEVACEELRKEYGNTAASFPTFISNLLGEDELDATIIRHCLSVADPENTGTLSQAAFLRAVIEWYRCRNELPEGVTRKEFAWAVAWGLVWCLTWAAVFSSLENWTYRESLWFCLVAMTTIGFGDFTPEHTSGRIACFLFIIPGITLTGSLFTAIWRAVQAKRFWVLQGLQQDGKVSPKLLEAFGIHVVIRRTNSYDASSQPLHRLHSTNGKEAPALTLTMQSVDADIELLPQTLPTQAVPPVATEADRGHMAPREESDGVYKLEQSITSMGTPPHHPVAPPSGHPKFTSAHPEISPRTAALPVSPADRRRVRAARRIQGRLPTGSDPPRRRGSERFWTEAPPLSPRSEEEELVTLGGTLKSLPRGGGSWRMESTRSRSPHQQRLSSADAQSAGSHSPQSTLVFAGTTCVLSSPGSAGRGNSHHMPPPSPTHGPEHPPNQSGQWWSGRDAHRSSTKSIQPQPGLESKSSFVSVQSGWGQSHKRHSPKSMQNVSRHRHSPPDDGRPVRRRGSGGDPLLGTWGQPHRRKSDAVHADEADHEHDEM